MLGDSENNGGGEVKSLSSDTVNVSVWFKPTPTSMGEMAVSPFSSPHLSALSFETRYFVDRVELPMLLRSTTQQFSP